MSESSGRRTDQQFCSDGLEPYRPNSLRIYITAIVLFQNGVFGFWHCSDVGSRAGQEHGILLVVPSDEELGKLLAGVMIAIKEGHEGSQPGVCSVQIAR